MTGTDPLRTFYKTLIGRGADPLEPDDPWYVSILQSSPESDPILALWLRIDLVESESVNLLTGFRRNGKSTELRRLKRELENVGCRVFPVDMLEYVSMTKHPALPDFTLSLMAALAGAAEKRLQKNGETPGALRDISVSLDKVALTARAMGRWEKAGTYFYEGLAIAESLSASLSNHSDYSGLADHFRSRLNDLDEKKQAMEKNDPDD